MVNVSDDGDVSDVFHGNIFLLFVGSDFFGGGDYAQHDPPRQRERIKKMELSRKVRKVRQEGKCVSRLLSWRSLRVWRELSDNKFPAYLRLTRFGMADSVR